MDDEELLTRDREMGRQRRQAAMDRFRVDLLIGLSVDEARAIVEAAGGVFQPRNGHEPLTMDYRLDRVTALIRSGRVVEASVG